MRHVLSIGYEPGFLRGLGVIPCPYHNYYQHDRMLAHAVMKAEKNYWKRIKNICRISFGN